MSHILLPQQQYQCFGHQMQETKLIQAVSQQTPGQAWIFWGPKGVGKTTLAYRFIRFLLASDKKPEYIQQAQYNNHMGIPESEPICRLIARGSCLDIKEIGQDDTKEINVDAIRNILPFIRTTSYHDTWRVILILDADNMNIHACNALLKMLEEPPQKTLFILCCVHPQRLSATLRSRCQKLQLHPLNSMDFSDAIRAWKPHWDNQTIHDLWIQSQGCPGRAIMMMDEDRSVYQPVYQQCIQILSYVDQQSWGQVLECLDQSLKEHHVALLTLGSGFITCLERMIKGQFGSCTSLSDDERKLFDRLASKIPMDQWFDYHKDLQNFIKKIDARHLDAPTALMSYFASWFNPTSQIKSGARS